jgi:hypothetical protein
MACPTDSAATIAVAHRQRGAGVAADYYAAIGSRRASPASKTSTIITNHPHWRLAFDAASGA